MRRTLLSLSLALVVTVSVTIPAQAITYGQLDGNLHPQVGALVARFDGQYDWLCSGTLISPTVFLTAAHCIVYLESLGIAPHDVWVSFDPVFSPTAKLLRGTFHRDPLYGTAPASDAHDIAVVVLDKAVRITPALLPTAGLLDQMKADLSSQTFTAVGYGSVRDSQQGGPAGLFGGGERRYVTQSSNALNATWLRLSMNPATGNGGTCYGDSGGPHFLGGPDSDLVVSLTVTGDAVCKSTDTTYRIDTPSARDFLGNYVALP